MEPNNGFFKKFIEKKDDLSKKEFGCINIEKVALEINSFFSYIFGYGNIEIVDFETYISDFVPTDPYDEIWHGGAGFFVTMYHIEQNLDLVKINKLLNLETVKLYLEKIYEIDKKWNLKYYKSGTTSYIFSGSTDYEKKRIFKIIKPRYTTNESITKQTKAYKETQPCLDFTPAIYKSNEYCIQMELIAGKTLKEINQQFAKFEKEFIGEEIKFKRYTHLRFVILSRIIIELITKLGILYDDFNQKPHGDLNPNNIIIKNLPDFSCENILKIDSKKLPLDFGLFIIDFGKNYLLNDDFGATSSVASVMVYASKEIIEGKTFSYKADIYSIGILILELMSNQEHFEAKSLDTYQTNLRDENPIIASLLNELLAEDSNFRLKEEYYLNLSTSSKHKINPYNYLKDIINTEFEIIISQLEPPSGELINRIEKIVITIISMDFVGAFSSFINKKKIITESFQNNTDSLYRSKLRLNFYRAIISNFASFLVLTCFFYFVIEKYSGNKLWEYFPGLFICALFAPLAHSYYMNIYSQISTKDLGTLGKIVEFWLWICTFYYAPIIIYFSIYFPNKWPLATFTGTLVIALNNTLHYYLAKKSIDAIVISNKNLNKSNVKLEMTDLIDLKVKLLKLELKDFRVWQLMYPFSIPMLILFVFLDSANAPDWMRLGSGFRLYDEAAYAAIIFIIILKLYFDNNMRQGPKLSSFLQYCYCEYRKVLFLAKNINNYPST
jgi:hypothetical protein